MIVPLLFDHGLSFFEFERHHAAAREQSDQESSKPIVTMQNRCGGVLSTVMAFLCVVLTITAHECAVGDALVCANPDGLVRANPKSEYV
jgi:hypothetical protein